MANSKKNTRIRDQSRKWLLTINNPDKHGFGHEKIKETLEMIENIDFWCMCDEIGGVTACYHTHLFIYRKKSPIKFDFMKRLFPTAHFDYPLGTSEDNRNYIRKEGKYEKSEKALTNLKDTFEEFGACPREEQGKRNDLNSLYGMIKDGLTDYEILEDNAEHMIRLDTISRVRETLRYEEFANCTRELHVEYWHGQPGSGKTFGVLNRYGYKNVYIVDDYKHPWDGYKGQDVVLFDEFKSGNYEITQLLRWLDVYPVSLPCRYNNKQACYTKVFFTSNYTFDEQYGSLKRNDYATFNALLRRFHCFRVFSKDGNIKDYKNLEEMKERFIEVDENYKLPWE